MASYHPFVDDPDDIARFEGHRFVVLRTTGAVAAEHRRVRSLLKTRLAGADVSYLAQAHVTLAGFPKGADLNGVRALVAEWAPSIAPLRLEIEKAGYFPAPYQIVMLQIRKTTALCDALVSLRARAAERGLSGTDMVDAADWVFHMSVAYCAALGPSEWTAVTQFVDALPVAAAECVLGEVEVVAIDGAREHSAVFHLTA